MLDRLGSQTRGPGDPRTLVAAFAAEYAATKTWLKGEPCFQVLCMNYNRLLENPRPRLAELQAFLSEAGRPPLDLDAMCGVVDPTLYRQRSNSGVDGMRA